MLYRLEPVAGCLHGQFTSEIPPALTVDSGDTVRFRTLDVSWGLEPPVDTVSPRARFEPRRSGLDEGPALAGPVFVREAEPGDTLEVHVEHVRPGPWGWTFAGGPGFLNGALNRALGVAEVPRRLLRWAVDPDAGTATSQTGLTVSLRPFPGIVGLAPAGPGLHSPWPPRRTGGNLDCRELVQGSVLHLPVEVAGAWLSAGDGHARQGDGEVAGMAIECPLERLDLRLVLRKGGAPKSVRADTPAGWITFGFGETLDAAAIEAVHGMLDLLQERHGLDQCEALALASAVVDVRVTQMVNGVVGVHAVLPHGAVG